MSLIEQARSNIAQTEQQTKEQDQADLICQQLRLECEKLLGDKGQKETDKLNKIVIIGTLPTSLLLARKYRINLFDVYSSLILRKSINGTGEPIAVTLSAPTVSPTRSGHLSISLEGLDSSLHLRKTHGSIGRHLVIGYSRKHGEFNEWIPDRRANLTDALAYREIVDLLKQ